MSETLARAAAGDNAAFASIVREHQAMVYSLAFHFLRDRARSEELAQEVFLQLYRSLSSIKSAEHLRFWLRKVTTNRCIDSVRAAQLSRQVSLDDAPEMIAPHVEMIDPALSQTLERYIAALPERQRLIVILRYQEELEPTEIAEILEMPVNEKRIVNEGEEVRIVDESNHTLWTLAPAPVTETDSFDNISFNGEFTFALDEPESYLLKPTSDGMRMRSVPASVKFGVKTDSVEGALATQLGLKPSSAMLVTETSEGVLTVNDGLKKFDVITHVDGKALAGEGEMWPTIYRKSQEAMGGKLTLRVIRNREAFDITYNIPPTASGNTWQAETVRASNAETALPSNTNGAIAPGAKDERHMSYQIGIGANPKLILINANGQLFIQRRQGSFEATINGQEVAQARIIRQGKLVRVTSERGETLFVICVLPNGSLIYTRALDPFTARGRLGLTTEEVGKALAAQLGLQPDEALLITDVAEGTPAERAGLKSSDIIVGIDRQAGFGTVTLDQIMFMKKQGDTLKLKVLRAGQIMEVVLELKDSPLWQDFTELEKLYLEVNKKLEDFPKL